MSFALITLSDKLSIIEPIIKSYGLNVENVLIKAFGKDYLSLSPLAAMQRWNKCYGGFVQLKPTETIADGIKHICEFFLEQCTSPTL